jgi:hypothetical protein
MEAFYCLQQDPFQGQHHRLKNSIRTSSLGYCPSQSYCRLKVDFVSMVAPFRHVIRHFKHNISSFSKISEIFHRVVHHIEDNEHITAAPVTPDRSWNNARRCSCFSVSSRLSPILHSRLIRCRSLRVTSSRFSVLGLPRGVIKEERLNRAQCKTRHMEWN